MTNLAQQNKGFARTGKLKIWFANVARTNAFTNILLTWNLAPLRRNRPFAFFRQYNCILGNLGASGTLSERYGDGTGFSGTAPPRLRRHTQPHHATKIYPLLTSRSGGTQASPPLSNTFTYHDTQHTAHTREPASQPATWAASQPPVSQPARSQPAGQPTSLPALAGPAWPMPAELGGGLP